jgi:hypothetical protein
VCSGAGDGRLLILTRRIGWFAAFVILLALVVSFSKLLIVLFRDGEKNASRSGD